MNFVKMLVIMIGLFIGSDLHAQYNSYVSEGYKERVSSYNLFGLKGKETRQVTRINPDGQIISEIKTVRIWERPLTFRSPYGYRSVVADMLGVPDLNNDRIVYIRQEHRTDRVQAVSTRCQKKVVLQIPTVPTAKVEVKKEVPKKHVLIIPQFPTRPKN